MKLEICANSYESALNAEKAGAHRIELCSELSVGGVTPSHGLLKMVIAKLKLPVYVLIRPRSGNFTYSAAEFALMKEDILHCKKLGCAGIVSGVLHEDNSLDLKRTQELVVLAKPLAFTFHRAFDLVLNPKETMQALIEMGVDRILSSGQQKEATDGINLLIALQQLANGKIIILPGSGINPQNCKLFAKAKFKEIHTSASKVTDHSKNSYFGNAQQTVADSTTIKEILNTINHA